jgi:hypothetical protein
MLFSEGISDEADVLIESLVAVGIQILRASPFYVLSEDQFTEGEVGVGG